MSLNPVTPAFLDQLRSDLPEPVFRPIHQHYLEEPRGHWQGQAGAVLAPQDSQQVSVILAAANAARIAVVPYGGGTGLVAGQVMETGPSPLVLSLERMTAIRAVIPQENVMIAEAGAILQDLHGAASAEDRLFPMTIASKGSARIGGCLGTNAGGVNVLRYGNTRDLVLGLEAVLADGRIYNGLTRLRKDNTGYDLRNLLIGSEGTLGVITAAALKLAPVPAGEGTALMVVSSPEAALELLAVARSQLGEAVSGFELIHRAGLEFLSEALPDLRQPFADKPDWMVLIDVGVSQGLDPAAALEAIFVTALEQGLVFDGLIAQSEKQRQDFWEIREQIPTANRHIGSISSHDISLPLSVIPEFITAANADIAEIADLRVNCFGHLGDGNLHYNVFPAPGRHKSDYSALRDVIQRRVHDRVVAMGGSFSAEHGVGRLKVEDLERYGDPTKLAMMRSIKSVLDPNGILNPGAVLRA